MGYFIFTNRFTKMMASKRNEQKDDAQSIGLSVGDMMSANGLKYRVSQALGSGVSRNFKKEYAQKGEYTKGQTLVVDWNTGTQYVSPDTALLGFSFNITQVADAGANREYS
jgi:hypothetical protein